MDKGEEYKKNIPPRNDILILLGTVVVGLALLLALFVYLYHPWFSRGVYEPSVQLGDLQTYTDSEGVEVVDVSEGSDPLYYVARSRAGLPRNATHLFRMGVATESRDTSVLSSEGYVDFFGNYTDDSSWLAARQSALLIVDALEESEDVVFDLETPHQSITGAILSPDETTILYSVQGVDPAGDRVGEYGEIWLYNVLTNEHTRVYSNLELGPLVLLRVQGWLADGNGILFGEVGGDAGHVWGREYLVRFRDGAYVVTELGADIEDRESFLRGSFSPDGRYISYSRCAIFSEIFVGSHSECEEGEEVVLYDVFAGEEQVIYKNESFADNVNMAKLRVVLSLSWLDENTLYVMTPEGIFDLDIQTGRVHLLYEYPTNDPIALLDAFPSFAYVDANRAVIHFYDHFSDLKLITFSSGRVVGLESPDYYIEKFLD